jgi:hypothetical protein
MRRLIALVAAVVAAVALGGLLPAAAASEPYCGIRWGSLPEVQDEYSNAQLVNVRAGRHGCYDRLVLDFQGDVDGYRVEYVSSFTTDGAGQVLPLRGDARLQIVPLAAAYDGVGNPTYRPANPSELVDVSGWRTFRQIAWAGSFEGQTTIGLGVRARLPFRVFILDGPGTGSRLVIDVAHRW